MNAKTFTLAKMIFIIFEPNTKQRRNIMRSSAGKSSLKQNSDRKVGSLNVSGASHRHNYRLLHDTHAADDVC